MAAASGTAAIYVRISNDDEGRELGVTRQREDCERLAKNLGVEDVVFQDNDISASTLSNKPRPGYAQMLEGVRNGTFNIIIAYSNSRLTRRPRELEDLIELNKDTGVLIKTVVSGDDDLSTADGKTVARYKAVADASEAERTSERVRRKKLQNAQMGKANGQRYRTFGFQRDWSVNESEADIVKEVFERAAKGEAKHSITKDLQNRGVTTTTGGVWRPIQTTRLLRTAKYAGLQIYKGEVIGKADVTPLVSEALYEAVQAPRRAATNARRYLLSGILVCSLCEQKMTGAKDASGNERYRCDPNSGGCGRLSIKAAWVDDILNRYMSNIVHTNYMYSEHVEQEPDNRLELIDAEIAYIINNTEDVAMRVEMVNEARRRRRAVVKEQSEIVSSPIPWQAAYDFDAMDVSLKGAAIKDVFPYIYVLPVGPGRQTTDTVDKRLIAVKPDGTKLPGAAFNVYDVRDRTDKTESVKPKPLQPKDVSGTV